MLTVLSSIPAQRTLHLFLKTCTNRTGIFSNPKRSHFSNKVLEKAVAERGEKTLNKTLDGSSPLPSS